MSQRKAAWPGAPAPRTTPVGEVWAAETEIRDTQGGGQTGEERRGNGSRCLTVEKGAANRKRKKRRMNSEVLDGDQGCGCALTAFNIQTDAETSLELNVDLYEFVFKQIELLSQLGMG